MPELEEALEGRDIKDLKKVYQSQSKCKLIWKKHTSNNNYKPKPLYSYKVYNKYLPNKFGKGWKQIS